MKKYIAFSQNKLYAVQRKEVTKLEVHERIKERREELGLSIRGLAEKLGLSPSTVMRYESTAIKSMGIDKIETLASALHTTPGYLMGWEEYHEIDDSAVVPVLGRVAAGIPMYAAENIIGQIRCSSEMAKDSELFALKISGVSMEPKIPNGSIVIVRKQDTAENGDIVIALVNGDDAVCKKYIRYENGAVALISLNLSYEPMVYESAAIDYLPVRIIGKVIEIRSTP